MSASCASIRSVDERARLWAERDGVSAKRRSRDLHRRRLLRQSRARRLGRDSELRRSEKELKGGEPHTTNNRMELMAAISALEALKRPCRVDLYTDSQYLRNGITAWIAAGSATAGEPRTKSR